MRYLIFAALLTAGCDAALPEREPITGGNPVRGKRLIVEFGCGSCHTIRGIPNADASVGPSLETVKKRVYLGGVVPHTAEQLAKWIADPRQFAPRTAMPVVGVTEAQARDIAAYLYTQSR